jgi:hypothetical protein
MTLPRCCASQAQLLLQPQHQAVAGRACYCCQGHKVTPLLGINVAPGEARRQVVQQQ